MPWNSRTRVHDHQPKAVRQLGARSPEAAASQSVCDVRKFADKTCDHEERRRSHPMNSDAWLESHIAVCKCKLVTTLSIPFECPTSHPVGKMRKHLRNSTSTSFGDGAGGCFSTWQHPVVARHHPQSPVTRSRSLCDRSPARLRNWPERQKIYGKWFMRSGLDALPVC